MTKFLGLTGSIGMGKTETAKMFAAGGAPVYDADAAVHALYEKGGAAVDPVGTAFPGVVEDGAIVRERLRDAVLKAPDALAHLNQIVHPLVAESQIAFRQSAQSSGSALAVLDIPLLFETGGDAACDYIAVVTAPAHIQRSRVLDRGTMSETEFEKILSKQTPDAEKRARADFVISTAFGFEFTAKHVSAIMELINSMESERPAQ